MPESTSTAGQPRQRVLGALVIVFMLPTVFSPRAQPASGSVFVDALWIAKTDRVLKIAAGTGTPLLEITDGKFVRAVAVDELRSIVWIYGDGMLRAFDFSGAYLRSAPLPSAAQNVSDANGRYVALAVNANSGSVWLAIEKQLFRLDASSPVFQMYSLPGNAVDLTVDQTASVLWLATREAIHGLSDAGSVIASIALAENAQIEDIDVEPESGRLWVACRDRLRRYSSRGALEVEQQIDGLQRAAAAGSGEVWAVTRDELMLLSSFATVISRIPLQRESPIEIVVNPLDATVWTARELALFHADRMGRVTHQMDFKGPPIRDLSFYADTIPPTIDFIAPAPSAYVNSKSPALRVSYADIGSGVNPDTLQFQFDVPDTPSVKQPLPVRCSFLAGSATCAPTNALPEGSILVSAFIRDVRGNLSASASVVFTIDATPPKITLTSHSSGLITSEAQHIFSGDLTEQADLKVNGQAVAVGKDLKFRHGPLVLNEGENTFTFIATDLAGNVSSLTLKITLSSLPPDPRTVAPSLDRTVVSTFAGATEFLYSGANPIQTGVAPGTIEARRAAVLRGRVQDRTGAPLSAVRVSVLGHDELGRTFTRADGFFDLAVNGGGTLVLAYQKDGHLPVQRQVNVPWQQYVVVPDVVLIPRDLRVSTIDFASNVPIQVARGSPVADADGSRQATMLFPAGTQAELVLPGGTIQPITNLQVRATEYTIGTSGPKAMPAPLPPTSGYTYAVELSADQAEAAGAVQVRFNRPLAFYVENFLNFPVGEMVPAGWYDREKALWVASDNGRVIKILSVTAGLADLDVNGSGLPANSAALASLGITDAERQTLAGLYAVNQSLWRVPVTHFTPWDCNWPYGPPADARPPGQPDPRQDALVDDPCRSQGSVIECENQVLGEALELTGSPFRLHYQSDRVVGRKAANTVTLPLTGSSVPASLKRVDLVIEVAGRQFSQSFTNALNQSYTFFWDGKDAYGRVLQGRQPLHARIGYVYDAVYMTAAQFARSFAVISGAPINGSRARQEITVWQDHDLMIGTWDARGLALGGWSLSVHHAYDVTGRTLYLGTGQKRSAESSYPVIRLTKPHPGAVKGLSAAPDGILYFSENHAILKLVPDGTLTVVAGTGVSGFSGDGGLATQARLSHADGTALAPDGSLYIADSSNQRIRRGAPDGIITTVAGTGESGYGGDGGPATQAKLANPLDVAVGPDGAVYVADTDNNRIRRIASDGTITTFVGTGVHGFSGDGGPAPSARLARPHAVAFDRQGRLYISDRSNHAVRRVGTDGIITTVAGNGAFGLTGDGGLATEAALGTPFGLAVDKDGSFYVALALFGEERVRRVDPTGVITTVAGSGQTGSAGDGGPAAQAPLDSPVDLAINGDGTVSIAVNSAVRSITPALPGFSPLDVVVPSEDGSELYVFDLQGRHLRTIDALTNAARFQFTYDAQGRLIQILDGEGDRTTFERDAAGNPTAIVTQDGQRTTLGLDGNGYLNRITNPANQGHTFTYTTDGLMNSLTNPRNQSFQFAYDASGRLQTDTDPATGVQTLVRSDISGGHEVTRTNSLNRMSRYRTEVLSTGNQSRTYTAPDGTQTTVTRNTDGRMITRLPDGMTFNTLEGADPRFGMQSPISRSQTITTPGGLASTTSTQRTVTLSNPNDVLPLIQQRDQVTINGRAFTSLFDVSPRRWTNTSAESRQTTMTVDPLGRILQQQVTGLQPLSFTYDQRGRLSSATQGTGTDGRTTSFTYNNAGFLATITDPLNRTTSFAYDSAGRMTAQTLWDNRLIQYAYDANGNITSITPPGRPAHTFAYTPVDLQENYTPPDVGAGINLTRFVYNLDRQLTQILRPDSQTVDFAYDSGGRLSTLTTSRGTTAFNYNAATGVLSSITAPGANTLTYSYDGSLLTNEAWSGEIAGNVSRAYDNNFRVTSHTINGGNTVSFAYDRDDLLTQAGSLALTRNAQNGLLTGTALGNTTDGWVYNGLGEPESYNASFSGTTLYSAGYTRDKLGRITEKTEALGGVADRFTYGYDTAGRLSEIKKNDVVISTYTYDSNGNRLTHTTSSGTTSGTYDNQDRLTQYGSTTYTYTANGELLTKTIAGQTTNYTYDALGNLTNVTLPDGTQISYVIDGQNRRIGKKVNGTLVQGFLYQDSLKPIAELDGTGAVVSIFVYASKFQVPDYMIKAGIAYRIVSDHLGSPRLVVNSTTGEIMQRMDYDEFGNITQDTNPGFQPYGFAGCLYDRHTGLLRFGARDYDAQVGRWTAKDPIGFLGNDANLYRYVLGDAVNFIDPLGQILLTPFFRLVSRDLGEAALKSNLSTAPFALMKRIYGIEYPCLPRSLQKVFNYSDIATGAWTAFRTSRWLALSGVGTANGISATAFLPGLTAFIGGALLGATINDVIIAPYTGGLTTAESFRILFED